MTGAEQDWAHVLLDQCRAARDEVALLAPWTSLGAPPAGLEDLLPHAQVPTLRELAELEDRALRPIAQALAVDRDDRARAWLLALRDAITAGGARARQQIAVIEDLARQASEFATVDFDFLYDRSRRLLTIGYNVTERRRDASYYDLLVRGETRQLRSHRAWAGCRRRAGLRWDGC